MHPVDECTVQSLLDRFDQNEDEQISLKELNAECNDGSKNHGIEASTSFIDLCSTNLHENYSQASAYLQCRDEDTSLLVNKISLDDPAMAELFCDVLVEHNCSSSIKMSSSPLPTPVLPLAIASGTLFVVSLIASWFVWKRNKRRVPSRTSNVDQEIVEDDEESSSEGTEVNDFSPSEKDWSSIGSSGSRTDASSMFPGQVIRRVAQGRIVADDAQDTVSLKKGEGESVEAFAIHEHAVYDFESIGEDGTTENNTTVYFDCVPFPSSSTAL